MLAVLGHLITTAGYRWSGALTVDVLKWEDIPSGLAAFDVILSTGAWQTFFYRLARHVI